MEERKEDSEGSEVEVRVKHAINLDEVVVKVYRKATMRHVKDKPAGQF